MAGKNTLFSSKLACTFLLAVGVSTGAWAAAKTGFSNHNSKDPIQFSADRLEVQKEGRVARFLGKVEAIQGDMTLLSDEVRVYYQQDDKKKQGEESSSLTGSVNRIDSRGNVRVTSRGDTAEGDWAVYDVPRQLITMGGRVVIHQSGSVVRGSRAELNLNSGQARVIGQPDQQGDNRVRGEFTPATKKSDSSDASKSDAKPAPAKKDK
jgi:lipopolysaccharide export system protein LptA